jgi:Putative zinc-finger
VPMRCEVAERELSARLDGEADRRLADALETHLARCARCRSFVAGAGRVRHLARLQPAGPVPDLIPRIMAEVRRQAGPRRLARLPGRPRPAWARYVAAFAAGAVTAALIVGGLPGLRRGPAPALATEIPREIAAASSEVTSYRARFDVLERGFHPRVPRRTFVAEIAFDAPERFRASITDTTSYPSELWPQGDSRLEVHGPRWLLRAPATCPREGLPACAVEDRVVRGVTGREPFDGDAVLPTDIVLPVRMLAGTERVGVVGEDEVLGRDAVLVELAYRDATPLFAYLQAGGSWRPFFPQDRVLVWLDAESWFPLAYEVRAAASPERSQWAMGNALPEEHPGSTLFRAEAVALRTDVGPLPPVDVPESARDEGFVDLSLEAAAAAVGYEPILPSDLLGLEPHRAGVFEASGHPPDEVLVSFARGLSWLKIRQTRAWSQPALFGDVSELAAPVRLDDALGYYEPATATLGRRLSIHAPGIDVYLETNLPRDELLQIAASLPVSGVTAPPGWLSRVSLGQALARAPYALVPSRLPDGYRLWAAELPAGEGITLHFRRPGVELDGTGIRIHQVAGQTMAPPLDPDVLAVRVRGVTGRYSPARAELEWVEEGVYRSVQGTALDLAGLLAVAESLEEPR